MHQKKYFEYVMIFEVDVSVFQNLHNKLFIELNPSF